MKSKVDFLNSMCWCIYNIDRNDEVREEIQKILFSLGWKWFGDDGESLIVEGNIGSLTSYKFPKNSYLVTEKTFGRSGSLLYSKAIAKKHYNVSNENNNAEKLIYIDYHDFLKLPDINYNKLPDNLVLI